MNLKKPKFWDQKKPNIIAYLLLPLSFLLDLLKFLRLNKKTKKSKIKTIIVGNIYLGGTGKTSLSIKINELLSERKIKSCFVKKFYPNQYDEQKLLQSRGKLFTSLKRIEAIKTAENKGYDVAILDDGLQDNSINYDLRFVCFNNINWIGNGFTIPAGPLRESVNNLKNYKHIFLNGNLENLDDIKRHIYKINPNIDIHIGKYVPLNIEKFNKDKNYLVFSGIGNHQTFVSMLREYKFNIVQDIEFSDHYKYNNFDINNIQKISNNLNCQIITTEKDYLRLDKEKIHNINFIKSELKILDEEKLISTILKINENN
jgi:tetraacyldisaccharide 4'-kinase